MPRNKRMTNCEDCLGHGWLLCHLEGPIPKKLEIQRCDACERFADDNAANAFVAKLAWKERLKTKRRNRAKTAH